ncbi:MAG: ATP phosphoribosyltransferase [Gammaproteobacteria bacterium]
MWQEALPLLCALGLAPKAECARSRRLILPTDDDGVRLIIARAQDTPTFVACGAAQIGIAGRDVLMEKPLADICHPLDLQIAKCRMVVAAPPDDDNGGGKNNTSASGGLVVATKYVNTARAFFANKGIAANFIKLGGNMEIAPMVGLADAIVDLVDTGKTLRDNGLEEKETIADISAMLIVNRIAARRRRGDIVKLQNRFAEVCAPKQ